jgi:hypothetical protein
VNELSTVYAEPAKRVVSSEAAQKTYDELLEQVQFDEQMLQLSRLLNLHRAMLVGFRVRVLPNGTRAPIVDMASPADVRVVMHPNDNKLPIGWIVRAGHRPVRELGDDRLPKWTLWTDVERMSLRDDMSIIGGTIVQHGLGVCPWVPVSAWPDSSWLLAGRGRRGSCRGARELVALEHLPAERAEVGDEAARPAGRRHEHRAFAGRRQRSSDRDG